MDRPSWGDYYYTVTERTRRGLTTVQCITQEVCKVIVSKLWNEFVIFPETVDQILIAVLQLEHKWQFPSSFGEVDGFHIPMKCSCSGNEVRKDYYNFKNFYSIVMMGIVGVGYHFCWITGSSNFSDLSSISKHSRQYIYLQFCWEIQLFHIMRGYKNHFDIQPSLGNSITSIAAWGRQEW